VNRVTTIHSLGSVNCVSGLPEHVNPKERKIADLKRREHLSRQQAAESLTDIAYALTAGGRLKLDGGEEVTVPVADQVVLKRASRSEGDRVELELELSWSKPSASPGEHSQGGSGHASFRRIAVGYDGGDGSRDALALARLVARRDADRLTLIRVLGRHELLPEAMPAPIRHDVDERRETLAAETREAADELGASASTLLAHSPAAGLERAAAELDADLIVVGSSSHGRVGQTLAGGTALRLLQGAPFPIALAPAGLRSHESPLRRVGVGYDGSPAAEAALELGIRLALEHGAAIEIIAVASYESTDPDFELLPAGADAGDELEALGGRVETEMRRLSPAVRVSSRVVLGDSVLELQDRAHELDFLVVGSRHHGPVGGVLLGSVTSEPVLSVPCPLLVAPITGQSELASASAGQT
jgi:amphi-Trp domain-containing protein